jgi:hypothetical protein
MTMDGLAVPAPQPTPNDANHSNIVNVVNGSSANFITSGVYGATIAGGGGSFYQFPQVSNSVTGDFGTVSGGYGNASSGADTVAGGIFNASSGFCDAIGGGQNNIAGGNEAVVAGGYANNNGADWGTVAGGELNHIFPTAHDSTIGGGFDNQIRTNAPYSTIGGGYQNTIALNSFGATIPGGALNGAAGAYSFAAGQHAKANHDGAFVWADFSQSSDFASTGPNQFLIRAAGGVGIGTSSPLAPLHVVGSGGSNLVLQDGVDSLYWSIYTEFCPGCAAGSGNLLFRNDSGIFGFIRHSDCAYIGGSDERLKRDIAPLNNVLERVLQLRPVSYRFRSDTSGGPRSLGFIAQEVEPLFPEVVGECQGMKGLAYSEFVPVTIGAIQELNRKLTHDLEEKQKEITDLRRQNESLEKRLEALESHFLNHKPN